MHAAQKDAKAKTAFARMVLMFLYKTEELEGKRLHKLDQDIVHAITGWHLIYIYIYFTKNGIYNKPLKPPDNNIIAIIKGSLYQLVSLLMREPQLHNY